MQSENYHVEGVYRKGLLLPYHDYMEFMPTVYSYTTPQVGLLKDI